MATFNALIARLSASSNDILVELLSSVRGMDRRMRNVENSEIHNISNRDSDLNRKIPRPLEAEKMIFELLESDMSPELVQEIMDDRKIPSRFVKETIERYLKKK